MAKPGYCRYNNTFEAQQMMGILFEFAQEKEYLFLKLDQRHCKLAVSHEIFYPLFYSIQPVLKPFPFTKLRHTANAFDWFTYIKNTVVSPNGKCLRYSNLFIPDSIMSNHFGSKLRRIVLMGYLPLNV